MRKLIQNSHKTSLVFKTFPLLEASKVSEVFKFKIFQQSCKVEFFSCQAKMYSFFPLKTLLFNKNSKIFILPLKFQTSKMNQNKDNIQQHHPGSVTIT